MPHAPPSVQAFFLSMGGGGRGKASAEFPAVGLHVFLHQAKEGTGGVRIHHVDALLTQCLHPNKSAEPQAFQVVGDGGLLHVTFLHEFRHGHGSLEEEQHELHPPGVADRLEECPVGFG